MQVSSLPVTVQSVALQQTPLGQEPLLQLTVHLSPVQETWLGQADSAQAMLVWVTAALSTWFWQDCGPLHSMVQVVLLSEQLTLPGQLFGPLQRSSQLSAPQRTSLMHAPCFSQRTSHELPPHWTFPAHELAPAHCTVQLVESWQSTPLEHEPSAWHRTWQPTPAGHFTCWLQGCAASHVTMQMSPMHLPMPAHAV